MPTVKFKLTFLGDAQRGVFAAFFWASISEMLAGRREEKRYEKRLLSPCPAIQSGPQIWVVLEECEPISISS
jgi:hypothetical protein